MKKIIALILLLCLTLTGCGRGPAPETTAPAVETTVPTETSATITYPVPGDAEMPLSDSGADWGLTLTAESVRRTGCTIRYTQSGGNPTGALQTGAYFTLEVYDGEWKSAKNLHPDEEITWNSLAYLITMGGEAEFAEDWSFLHGPLTPGWYRIGKEIMDFRSPGYYDTAIFYAYFEIYS